MLAIERRDKILERMNLGKSIVIADLSREFHVTTETIRRDLAKLEADGLVKKTHGGAVAIDSLKQELPFHTRKKSNIDKKLAIAKRVAELIPDNSSIMLDSSSTATFTVNQLGSRQNLILITNSVEAILNTASFPGCKVLCTGGELKRGGFSFIGDRAEEAIASLYADFCIISCKGLNREAGITDTNDNDIQIKRTMLAHSKKHILVADSTKLDRVSLMRAFDFRDIDVLVTDCTPSEEWKKFLEETQVELLSCD